MIIFGLKEMQAWATSKGLCYENLNEDSATTLGI